MSVGFALIFQQIKALFEALCSASCVERSAELVEKGPNQVIQDACHYVLG